MRQKMTASAWPWPCGGVSLTGPGRSQWCLRLPMPARERWLPTAGRSCPSSAPRTQAPTAPATSPAPRLRCCAASSSSLRLAAYTSLPSTTSWPRTAYSCAARHPQRRKPSHSAPPGWRRAFWFSSGTLTTSWCGRCGWLQDSGPWASQARLPWPTRQRAGSARLWTAVSGAGRSAWRSKAGRPCSWRCRGRRPARRLVRHRCRRRQQLCSRRPRRRRQLLPAAPGRTAAA
mmetsp:Transcript_60930/g.196311  ORF Transcript_60930/g.196311 Transcript_60930/m.196311 type:complete len:231 (-) Transcript_60930:105-797(-)